MTRQNDLVSCVKDLYYAGLTTSVSGNHSIRYKSWMWITPSGIPRYSITAPDLVRMSIQTGKAIGSRKPSIEAGMHRKIYQLCPNILSIVHTHSPFTIAVSISSEFRHVIEEAELVVGSPSVIPNKPSGSGELAVAVANEFRAGAKAVVVKNHGVVAGAPSIQQARAIVESLEEWSKILAISNMFGHARESLRKN